MNSFCVTVPALILLLVLSTPVKGDIPCTMDSSKCVCSSSNFTLNIGDAFPQEGYVNISGSAGSTNSFVLSPCKDFDCGGKPSRACQWDAGSEVFHVVGTAEEVEWTVESTTKFKVTFGKGDPIFNQHVRAGAIRCIADASVTEPKYSYDGEGNPNTDNPLVFSFTVTASSFEHPSPSPTPSPPSPCSGGVLIYIILVMLAMILGLLLLGTALLLIILKKVYSKSYAVSSQPKYKQLAFSSQ